MKSNTRYQTLSEGVLSPRRFNHLALSGKIVDGRAGGLIFGRTYEEGAILAVQKMGFEYIIRGFVEGGQFVVNAEGASHHAGRLKAMNSGDTLREIVSSISEAAPLDASQLIVTHARPHDRLVLLDWAQVIVTTEAAAKHLVELSEINRAINPYLECDHRELFLTVRDYSEGGES